MNTTNPQRIKKLNNFEYKAGEIIYWMSRDQRVNDNWALLYAQELAEKYHTTLSVVFCLRPEFEYATQRMLDFMFSGLKKVEKDLREKNISFYFLIGDPGIEIINFLNKQKIGALITDFSPLKINTQWKNKLTNDLEIPFFEVDAHNIVPVWVASEKQEFAAYTIRPKINRLLPIFLEEFPAVNKQKNSKLPELTNWEEVLLIIKYDNSIKKVNWLNSGESEAKKTLQNFINERLENYDLDRNDPNKNAQSNLSPYIHFGQISSQRIALEIEKTKVNKNSKEAYLEELIVRKELSDNFCYYSKNYDNFNGFPNWAKETLEKHKNDKKEFIYNFQEFKNAKTHDPLWNSAQKEMVIKGKMHGYLRMYWAKKIFEWSENASEAQKIAIKLNNTYFLDGRDPNGYAGIAWSIGGVHDRAWFERPIFGKIRYMNFNGARKKFDVQNYINMYK